MAADAGGCNFDGVVAVVFVVLSSSGKEEGSAVSLSTPTTMGSPVRTRSWRKRGWIVGGDCCEDDDDS